MMTPRRGDLVQETGIAVGLHVIGNEKATDKFYSTIGDTRWIVGQIDKPSQSVLLVNGKQFMASPNLSLDEARHAPGLECYWMDICDLIECFNYDLDFLTLDVAKQSLQKWDD